MAKEFLNNKIICEMEEIIFLNMMRRTAPSLTCGFLWNWWDVDITNMDGMLVQILQMLSNRLLEFADRVDSQLRGFCKRQGRQHQQGLVGEKSRQGRAAGPRRCRLMLKNVGEAAKERGKRQLSNCRPPPIADKDGH
jgi:hypothetical protein